MPKFHAPEKKTSGDEYVRERHTDVFQESQIINGTGLKTCNPV